MFRDIFQEVKFTDIPKILVFLNSSWPKHFLLQQYMTLISENINKTPDMQQTVYCAGDLHSGVYLVKTKFLITPEPFSLFFIHPTSCNLSMLSQALTETHIIPWRSTRFMFEVTMERFTPVVGRVFVAKGVPAMVQHYSLLWLPPEIPVNCSQPPGDVFIDLLEERHAEEIAQYWPGFSGNEKFIAGEISVSQGFGVFRKSDGKMVTSILSFHSGGVFMLYSLPEVRRNGYAEIILRHVIKHLRQKNIIPFCTVFSDNIPSQKLVRKVGFKDFDKANYIFPSELLP